MAATYRRKPSYKGVDPATEGLLAIQARSGETAAFEALVTAYRRWLFKFFCNRAVPPARAEELTQETFLKAYRGIGRYDPKRSRFKTWLCTIGLNLWRDELKRLRARPEPALLKSEVPGKDRGLQEVEEADRFFRWMKLLDQESAELVIMRYRDDLSYAEIRDATGIAEATVRSKVHRAVKRLRDRISSEEAAL